MKDRFEIALFTWGAKVLIDVRMILEQNEMYEDCQLINELLSNYGIETDFNLDDWQASIWKFGFAGDIAKNRIGIYLNKAMAFLYKDLKFDNPYHKVGKLFFNPSTGEMWSE